MKKIKVISASIITIFSLISCGNKDNNTSIANNSTSATTEEKSNKEDSTSQIKSDVDIDVKVTLDCNGGYLDTTELTLTYKKEYSLPIPESSSALGNVVFSGWYYQGIKIENQGDSFPYSSNITLKAKWENQDFTFKLNGDNTYSISGVKTKNIDVVIPSLYNGLKVTRIAKRAFSNNKKIKTLSLPDTIETIDQLAFYDCSALESISFTSSIKSILDSAFEECKNLKRVYFDGNKNDFLNIEFSSNGNPCCNGANLYFKNQLVTKIEVPNTIIELNSYAFNGVTSLIEVVLPSNLETIGTCAFSGCSNLKKINFPDALTSLGECAFNRCDLSSISLPSNITTIPYACFKNNYYLESVTLPNELIEIGSSAFENCLDLKNINIPSKVTNIESSAFYKCSSLETVTFPDSLLTIGSSAFAYDTSIKALSFGKNINSIAYGAFSTTVSVESITIDSENKIYKTDNNCLILKSEDEIILGCKNSTIPNYIKTIGKQAFFGCNRLTEITFPSSVTTIDNYAFSNCSSLTSIFIPASITYIGANAFTCCSKIESFTVDENNINYSSSNNCLLTKDKKDLIYGCKTSTIPETVETIDDEAFYFCTLLESISIPSNVKKIGVRAFANCYSLKTITISDGVTEIDEECFANSSDLTSITLPNTSATISKKCFSNCHSLNTLSIQEGVTKIEDKAFQYCYNLKTLSLPSTLQEIEEGCFLSDNDLNNIIIPENNNYFIFKNNMLLDKNETKLYLGLGNIQFLDTIEDIMPYALYNNEEITELTLNDGLKTIGHDALSYMSSLTKVTIPNSVTKIDDNAFYNDKNLEEVNYLGTKSEFSNITFGYSIFTSTYVSEITCSDENYELDEMFYI